MKHLLGAAFVIAVVILIIIGLTTDEQSMDVHMDQTMTSDTMPEHGGHNGMHN
ncbi:hypothetical protein MWU49_14705 [Alcanivorax sp. S6407]|uniref:hypothetical protein n=1 Tax=Alcanivorax sp. S6407 TaxID=2926424 RepID=UPI001FF5EA93|nr:hypothetical protein [Alcanivorax sp. S6407]MCK0154963.1 hypothetical protein [Alcanivorax sp. S6407]